ncbi:MAG: hypothetical protein ABIF09_05105, partial [Gemmatimonadota bacterium]
MTKKMRRTLGVAALVADLLTGCVVGVVDLDDDSHHSGDAEASATFSRNLAWSDQIAVKVTGANGSVRIWGVPGAHEVVVDAVRRVRSDSRRDAEEHLADVQVSVQTGPQEFEIKTVQPNHSDGRSYIVDYEITVPAHLFPIVTQGNGFIRLEGIHADMEVTNGNGNVALVDVT